VKPTSAIVPAPPPAHLKQPVRAMPLPPNSVFYPGALQDR
jgi:hypothetical protein